MRINQEKVALHQEHGELLIGMHPFPAKQNYWSTFAFRQAPLLILGILFVGKRIWTETEIKAP